MSKPAPRSGPALTQILTRRLLLVAVLVVIVNAVAVGIDYGTDRRTLETELVIDQVEAIEDALEGTTVPDDAPVRSLYTAYPEAYAFALVNRSGVVIEMVNPLLIPPSATDIFADDWITRIDRPDMPLMVAGHEFENRSDGLRMVFAMRGDPARLMWRTYGDMFYEHVVLPILPLVILLVGTSILLTRRSLAPIKAAAAWAQDLRPGVPSTPPDVRLPAEIAELVNATERSVARLAQAFESEKRRAAEAAHALRTPVAVLVARVDALPPGDTKEQLRADLTTLSRTVQQVLAAGRAESLDKAQPIDLRSPAETVIAALAPFAYAHGVTLALDASADPAVALADPEAVQLALSNLIENAILHGGKGTVEIKVGPGPVASVRDHGPGLPNAEAHQLFEPFWRSPDAAPGGTGLGLSIVDRVQRAQGGRVEPQTAQGGGAEFVLHWQNPET